MIMHGEISKFSVYIYILYSYRFQDILNFVVLKLVHYNVIINLCKVHI